MIVEEQEFKKVLDYVKGLRGQITDAQYFKLLARLGFICTVMSKEFYSEPIPPFAIRKGEEKCLTI